MLLVSLRQNVDRLFAAMSFSIFLPWTVISPWMCLHLSLLNPLTLSIVSIHRYGGVWKSSISSYWWTTLIALLGWAASIFGGIIRASAQWSCAVLQSCDSVFSNTEIWREAIISLIFCFAQNHLSGHIRLCLALALTNIHISHILPLGEVVPLAELWLPGGGKWERIGAGQSYGATAASASLTGGGGSEGVEVVQCVWWLMESGIGFGCVIRVVKYLTLANGICLHPALDHSKQHWLFLLCARPSLPCVKCFPHMYCQIHVSVIKMLCWLRFKTFGGIRGVMVSNANELHKE